MNSSGSTSNGEEGDNNNNNYHGDGRSYAIEKDRYQFNDQEDITFIPPNYIQGNRYQGMKPMQNKITNIYHKTIKLNNKRQHPHPSHHHHVHHTQHHYEQQVNELTQQHMSLASQVLNNTTSLVLKSKQVQLPFTIFDYSSYSGTYHPQNIYVNKPDQQASRWSSSSHDHEQFITIKFDKPVVARTIMFGKFHKGHVCNLKEFKVFGGMDPNDDMIELLHHGLKNDTEPETFTLNHQYNNLVLPVQYLKIVPLSAFGANFNYSIWYVEIRGILEDSITQRVYTEYEQYKESETMRLCLKYFRQKNMMDVFHLLRNRTGVELEHPFVSDLHRYLVTEGNFEAAEQVLHQAYQRDIYQSYSEGSTYTPIWKKMNTQEGPCARGGHQMCIDVEDRKIYVLGGWDGHKDLSDFWCFDIQTNQWHLISADTQIQGGPSARSCHKICFEPISKSIFVLGRYVESQAMLGQTLESDFYRYYVEIDQWVKLNDNTAREGGPELIFDHQMCVDSENDLLYVFGGRTVNSDSNVQNYSGLYAYNIMTNHWKLLRNDDLKSSLKYSVPLKSRVGHSMLFDQTHRSLYVFAGQRVKDYLSDLYRYDVDSDIVTEIAQDASKDAGPDAGFTQRATMDEDLEELYVLSGYMKNTAVDVVKNSFWVYSIKKNEWQKVYQNESNRENQEMPCPRFAHQMVYDSLTKRQYIFGGNPGDHLDSTRRLNDFWQLELVKPEPSGILRKSVYRLRMQKLKELCTYNTTEEMLLALDYLRSQVEPMVNHEDQVESKEFHQMCANLCLLMDQDVLISDNRKTKDVLYEERTRLFEKLLEYIPEEMKEPLGRLTNAVKLK